MKEETRGKRVLALWMFSFLASMFVLGVAYDGPLEIAYFLTPWIFGSGLALFGLDGKFANDRELLRISGERARSANRGRTKPQCQCASGEDECPDCGGVKDRHSDSKTKGPR
jgi:hypothetical protein